MKRGLWERAEHGLEKKLYIYEDVVSESGSDTMVPYLQNFVVGTAFQEPHPLTAEQCRHKACQKYLAGTRIITMVACAGSGKMA